LSIIIPGISLAIFTENNAGTLTFFIDFLVLLVRRSISWEPSVLLIGLRLQNLV